MSETDENAEFVVTNNTEQSRYELHRGTTLTGVADYRDDGTTVAITRVFTVPTFRKQGMAARVMDGAVADITARGGRNVDAVCWYAAEWFEKHPEHSGLLRQR
ncbi:GNAT family N-acetyltransferase [Microbacterium sp. YY-01]|uniref:GNAT family N-acetyltransferase n=1 Tax=Microbacterium sp. YY-01 TaxID=3421634 RepID=UPI003D17522E